MKLPLTLPYPEASTICDASGSSIAECRDNETARAITRMVNDFWQLTSITPEDVASWGKVYNEMGSEEAR